MLGRNLRDGRLSLEAAPRGFPPVRSNDRARIVDGDILISARGSSNPAVLVGAIEADLYASLDVVVVRVRDDRIIPAYLVTYLNLPSTQAQLVEHRTTGVLPRIPLAALAELCIPMPPIAEQNAIAALAMAAHREATILNELIDKRSRLLNELLRRSAEGEPMPSANSAWVSSRSDSTEVDPEQFPLE